jgi:hypothetical protein
MQQVCLGVCLQGHHMMKDAPAASNMLYYQRLTPPEAAVMHPMCLAYTIAVQNCRSGGRQHASCDNRLVGAATTKR